MMNKIIRKKTYMYRTVLFILKKKNASISVPMRFKPVLFKGGLELFLEGASFSMEVVGGEK